MTFHFLRLALATLSSLQFCSISEDSYTKAEANMTTVMAVEDVIAVLEEEDTTMDVVAEAARWGKIW